MQSNPLKDMNTTSTTRRDFLASTGALAAAAVSAPAVAAAALAPTRSETLVKRLYDSLDEKQRKAVCFPWDHKSANGLLRTHISNNWRITPQAIASNFYTATQQALIREVWKGLVNPDWVARFDQQFKDDLGGWGLRQGIAIFGTPGGGPFEFVLTGRHGTIRCDGNSADHVAFGGPIMYGHEGSSGYFEKPGHPDNVFWHQALEANHLYRMLDGKLREQALLAAAPDEGEVAFRGPKGKFSGVAVADLARDQKEHLQKVLRLLLEPFRQSDVDEAVAALRKQGGLDRCHVCFYRADDLGGDGIWDNWRLEGPAFVWHWRGAPHVHVWVHVSDDPAVELNGKNRSGALRQ